MNSTHKKQQAQTVKFLSDFFGATPPGQAQPMLGLSAEVPLNQNQPEFWADAPWRLEPDQNTLPLLFLVRDGNVQPPARGPWRLDMLKVEQRLPAGPWESVLTLLPTDLPLVDAQGNFQRRTWWHSLHLPLAAFKGIHRGDMLHLRAVFHGSYFPHDHPARIEVHLETYLAVHPLPLSRAASMGGPRQWFYGDTHYHSVYTNDIKEIGNPVPESCIAAHAIGLDWLVITDHSCDLDDVDPDASPLTRWERLKADVANPAVSNDHFCCIQGEEITLAGGKDNYVHMLAFGGMQDVIEGGFLPFEGGFMSEVFQDSLAKWLKKIAKEGGYPAGETQRLFGPIHPFEKVLEMLPPETLLFAAHPFTLAQPPPPGKWETQDLYHHRLTGYEFWNSRTRRSTMLTLNPFARQQWDNPAKLIENDQARIRKVKAWADGAWELSLRRGLKFWSSAEALPRLRPVFLAGSDAHGSFNYSVGMSWDYRRRLIVDDDALGKVRTVVYLPSPFTGTVPPEADILSAIRKGSCAVTDGPILEFSLTAHGTTARLGEALVVSEGEDIHLKIHAFSTPEFGSVEQVELVTCFRHYRKAEKTLILRGQTVELPVNGAQGYCRLFAQTAGREGELFCCFTNPIWARCLVGKPGKIIATFA